MLAAMGLSKRFGGLRVLEDVGLSLAAGETRLIVGPNGAGKTTLLRMLMGFVQPDSGSITLDGVRIEALAPHQRRGRGVALAYQTPAPVPSLTVRENALLAAVPEVGVWRSLALHRYAPGLIRRVSDTLETVGLGGLEQRASDTLSHAERKLLEVACCLVRPPRLLLLDEPTAGLSEPEALRIGDVLLRLEERPAMIVVAHDIAFARRLNARVSFLHNGRILREGSIGELESDPIVRAAYFGEAA